jgi:transcriptional regulator with XRE-family HTH domain
MVKPTVTAWPSARLIRAARVLAGIDQSTLAADAGVAQKTVARIEADFSGSTDARRLEMLKLLSRVFAERYGIEFFEATEQSGEGLRFRKR